MKPLVFGSAARYLAGFLLFSLSLGLAALLMMPAASAVYTRPAVILAEHPPVIVIDAGHGGEDGGASGSDGTLEKDLNLLVADSVAEILAAAGYDVRRTRSDDRLLYDLYGELSDYTGHKKTYDLRNRLRFTREADAALLVSIHMNKFPDARYHGLQVYYSAAQPLSQAVAGNIQSYTKRYLQPDNTREIKRATSAIYLLHRCEIPAVMVECGFLSNDAELAQLKDETYRLTLALTIACAVAESLQAAAQ